MKKALVVISGKILNKPFPFTEIPVLFEVIEDYLRAQDVYAARTIVTLSREHSFASYYFLDAGVEAVPADDEDVQASAAIMREACSNQPPDVTVFLFGGDGFVNFSRSLAGRTRRVLARLPGVPSGAEGAKFPCEEILDLDLALKRAGYDWNSFELFDWKQFAADEGLDELDSFEPRPRAAVETVLPKALIVEAETPDPEEPDDTVVAKNDPPDREELERPTAVEIPIAPTSEEEKRLEYEKFKILAPEWNAAIEKTLSAYEDPKDRRWELVDAAETLDERFPGFYNFVWERGDDNGAFLQLLDRTNLDYVVDSFNVKYIYHSTQPELSAERSNGGVCADRGVLSLCGGWTSEFSAHQARNAARLAEERDKECDALAALRGNIAGYSVDPGERPDFLPALTSEEYETLALTYSVLARALNLLADVAENTTIFSDDYVVEVLQSAADSYCVVNGYLRGVHGIPEADEALKEAYGAIAAFANCRAYEARNLGRGDYLSVEELAKIADALAKQRRAYDRADRFDKAFKKRLSELDAVVDEIERTPKHDDFDAWVECMGVVDDICENLGVPRDSKELRGVLQKCVDYLPEGLIKSGTFDEVVRGVLETRAAE